MPYRGGRGDYYRGDYYRGDPGLFSFLGGIAKTALGFVPGVGGALSRLVTKPITGPGAGTFLGLGGGGTSAAVTPIGSSTAATPTGPRPHYVPGVGVVSQRGAHHVYGGVVGHPGGGIMGPPAITAGAGVGTLRGYRGYHPAKDGSGRLVKNRRMNWANPKALIRCERRVGSFLRHARRFIHYYSPKAHKGKMYFKTTKRRTKR